MATSDTNVVINIETLLRGLDKTVRGLDTVEKKLRTVAGVKIDPSKSTSSAAFDKAALSAKKLLLQQQRLATQSQQLVNQQERVRQATERLAKAQERAAKALTPRLGPAADAHVKAFQSAEKAVERLRVAQLRLENQAASSLQRQRNTALINNFKAEEKAAIQAAKTREREAKRAADAEIREARRAAAPPKLGTQSDAHVREFRAREAATQRSAAAQKRSEDQAARATADSARRSARQVQQINAQTRRQAEQSAKAQERAETQLANHRIREAQRAARAQARALEQTIAAQRAANVQGGAGAGVFGAATIGGLIGGATVAAIAGLSSTLQQGAQAWINYASKIENARIAFSTMLGGAADAEDHLNRLKRFALETPFAFDELVDASQRMQALGFRAEEVIPVLRDVGNAVAAAGGGSERLERVIKALSDVRARGTLQSQEIRQFAEAGISAFQILREETGKTTVELQDMVEKGQISADFFLKAFQKFSQIHFGDLMEQQSKTFLGALSNIRDVLLQLAASAFDPLFKRISEIAVRVQAELQKTRDLQGVAEVLADGFFELGGFLGEKILEGILSRLTSLTFWERVGNQIARQSANFLRSFGAEVQNTLAEAATGRVRGETTAFDLVRARTLEIFKQAVGGIGNTAATAKKKLDDLTKSQEENAKVTDKIIDIYTDLTHRLGDVSSVSFELATRQSLLRAGAEDLTTGYAALAIALAKAADAQKELSERTEAEDKRVRERNKSLKDQLEALRDSTRLALAEIAAAEQGGLTETERFNAELGAQVEGIINAARETGQFTTELEALNEALTLTRTLLGQLDTEKASRKAQEDAKKLQEIRRNIRESLQELQTGIDRQLSGKDLTELEQTADRVQQTLENLKVPAGALDPLIKLFQEPSVDTPQLIEKIQQILSTVRGELGPEFDNVSQSIIRAFRSARLLDDQIKEAAETTARLNQLSIGLRIEEGRVQDRILDGTITERQGRAELVALQRQYKEELLKILNIELKRAEVRDDKTAILNIQAEIEEVKRLGQVIDEAGQRINQELFGDIQQGLEGIFEGARRGIDGLKDALINFGESILNTFNRIAAESITQKFENIFKPDATDTKGTPGGFLSKLFGLTPKPADAGAGAALTTAAVTAGTSLTTGGVSAGAALTTGGATAGATLAASIAAAAAGFSAAVIAAGAAFAAAVAASAVAQSASGAVDAAGSIFGTATGDFFAPKPAGRIIRVAEAGYPEAVLTTDPKHATRQAQILKEYLARTKGLFGRFKIPEFDRGGWAQEAEQNMLASIHRQPTSLGNIPDSALAGGTQSGGMSVRVINQLTSKTATRPYMNSEEGVRDILNIISANSDEIGRRIGVK